MKLKVEYNMAPLMAAVDEARRRHVPFAAAIGMTATAAVARREIVNEMRRTLDRPMPKTVSEKSGPMFLKTADYKKLRAGVGDFAEVRIKDRARGKTGVGGASDPAIVWLSHLVYGGPRADKRSEVLLRRAGKMPPGHYLVPAATMPRDQFGNVPRGTLQRVVGDLRGNSLAGFDANITPTSKGKRRAKKARRPEFYFSTWPISIRTRHLTPGIYRRIEFAFGSSIQPAFFFVKGAPKYRRMIRFHEICDQVARFRGPIEFNRAMRYAIANPRGSGLEQLFLNV